MYACMLLTIHRTRLASLWSAVSVGKCGSNSNKNPQTGVLPRCVLNGGNVFLFNEPLNVKGQLIPQKSLIIAVESYNMSEMQQRLRLKTNKL